MRPSMFMGAGVRKRAEFVGFAWQQLPSGSPPEFTQAALNLAGISGLEDRDYVMVFAQGLAASAYGYMSPAPGWTQDNYVWMPGYGYRSSVMHRRITQAQINSPPQIVYRASSMVLLVAYRGPTSAVRRTISYDDDGNSTHVVPGFTRGADCIGVVCSIFDRDTATEDFAVSSGWTRRGIETVGHFRGAIADALGRGDYIDGASLTWSGLGTAGPYAQVAQMYELRAS